MLFNFLIRKNYTDSTVKNIGHWFCSQISTADHKYLWFRFGKMYFLALVLIFFAVAGHSVYGILSRGKCIRLTELLISLSSSSPSHTHTHTHTHTHKDDNGGPKR